jgi:hypothetical protein
MKAQAAPNHRKRKSKTVESNLMGLEERLKW